MKCETLIVHGWCAACYAARRGREAGHRKLPRLPVPVFNPFEAADMAMKRPDAEATPQAGQPLQDEVFSGFYPTLFSHMSETRWDDGKPRKTTTLLVFVENGKWKAHVNDRDGRRGFWVSADAWEQLLESADEAIDSVSTEWRKDTR